MLVSFSNLLDNSNIKENNIIKNEVNDIKNIIDNNDYVKLDLYIKINTNKYVYRNKDHTLTEKLEMLENTVEIRNENGIYKVSPLIYSVYTHKYIITKMMLKNHSRLDVTYKIPSTEIKDEEVSFIGLIFYNYFFEYSNMDEKNQLYELIDIIINNELYSKQIFEIKFGVLNEFKDVTMKSLHPIIMSIISNDNKMFNKLYLLINYNDKLMLKILMVNINNLENIFNNVDHQDEYEKIIKYITYMKEIQYKIVEANDIITICGKYLIAKEENSKKMHLDMFKKYLENVSNNDDYHNLSSVLINNVLYQLKNIINGINVYRNIIDNSRFLAKIVNTYLYLSRFSNMCITVDDYLIKSEPWMAFKYALMEGYQYIIMNFINNFKDNKLFYVDIQDGNTILQYALILFQDQNIINNIMLKSDIGKKNNDGVSPIFYLFHMINNENEFRFYQIYKRIYIESINLCINNNTYISYLPNDVKILLKNYY